MKKLLVFIACISCTTYCSAQLPGNSLRLKANNNYISVADAANTSLNNTMTWEFWIYYHCENGIAPRYPLTKGWCNNTWSYYFEMENGEIHFQKFDPAGTGNCVNGAGVGYTTSADALPFNTWTHVAAVMSGNTFQFYINGQAVSTTIASGSAFTGIHTSAMPVIIGAYESVGGTYVGVLANMDDLRIWHTARTAAEIAANYQNEISGNEPGLMAYYKLNESGSGAGVNVANSAVGSPIPNGTTQGTPANIYFENNNNVQNKIPICDPILWLRADTGITLNGFNEVTQWADQSGNNNHAVADGTTLPTVIANGINNRPVVDFTDDRMATQLVNLTATNKTEAFLVYKGIDASPFTPFEFADDGNVVTTGFLIADQDNSCPGCMNDVAASLKGDVWYNQNTLNQTQGCPKIINATFDKSLATEEVKIWLNGILQPKTPGTLNADNLNNFGSHKFYLGKRSANCVYCPGIMGEFYYAEIIIYNRVLDSAEKARVNAYLQGKYFSGTAASFTALPSAQINNTAIYDDYIWKHSLNAANPNEVIASVKDNCLTLGTRNDTVYVEPSAGLYNGQRYMRRHYVINTALNPAGTKRVRLYYTNADFSDLQSFIPSLNSHSELVVTKYDGPGENGFYDPAGGTITFIPSNQITTGTAFGQRYLEFEVTGFSEFWIHTGNTPLPLNLLSFTAHKLNEGALLNWTAGNMKDVLGFDIEKSTDALNYSKIGFVTATEENKYSFTDDALTERNNYYRLKLLDKDGNFTYSKTELLINNEMIAISLYPNPVKNELNIVSSSPEFGYEILDVSGSVILYGQSLSFHQSIATALLSKGMYYIKISDRNQTRTLRFTKE